MVTKALRRKAKWKKFVDEKPVGYIIEETEFNQYRVIARHNDPFIDYIVREGMTKKAAEGLCQTLAATNGLSARNDSVNKKS